jgi:GNAT superfamily N-acetyltransferase
MRVSSGRRSEDVVAARLPWTSPVLSQWYGQDRLRAQLATSLATELGRIGDEGFARSYRQAVELDIDADVLSWSNRILTPEDGTGWALAGIRFRGMDAGLPFVDVIACTEAFTRAGLLAVAAGAARAYGAFGPLCTRFAVPDADGFMKLVADGFGPRSTIDMQIVAGLIRRLRAAPRVATYERVELKAGDPSLLADRARDIYADLAAERPVTALWATPEGADSLGQCAGEGLLFDVAVDGRPAGVAAALREDAHGMAGFVVQEIALDRAHRGRGLGPAVLQRLADQLPDRGTDVVWGMIHPDNVASMRNALRVGRRPVGAYAWVTPPGLPGMPV